MRSAFSCSPAPASIRRRWPTFFESLSRVEGLARAEIPALLQDHPVTSERIAAARHARRANARACPRSPNR